MSQCNVRSFQEMISFGLEANSVSCIKSLGCPQQHDWVQHPTPLWDLPQLSKVSVFPSLTLRPSLTVRSVARFFFWRCDKIPCFSYLPLEVRELTKKQTDLTSCFCKVNFELRGRRKEVGMLASSLAKYTVSHLSFKGAWTNISYWSERDKLARFILQYGTNSVTHVVVAKLCSGWWVTSCANVIFLLCWQQWWCLLHDDTFWFMWRLLLLHANALFTY